MISYLISYMLFRFREEKAGTANSTAMHTITIFRRPASGERLPPVARLPLHDFPRTTSGLTQTASGARLPASLARLPVHGFQRTDSGFALTASGARRNYDGPATHDLGSFILMSDCL